MTNELIASKIEKIKNDFEVGNYQGVIDEAHGLIKDNIYYFEAFEKYAYVLYFSRHFENCLNIISIIESKEHITQSLKNVKAECLISTGKFVLANSVIEDLINTSDFSKNSMGLNSQLIYSYFHSGMDRKGYEKFFELNPGFKTYNSLYSIVIPVLDKSPGTPEHNIEALLEDLTGVDCEVIVVFNNPELGVELKNHPRIDHYAIISENLGVSRAWNIGLNISRSKYTIIANADLKISEKCFIDLVNVMEDREDCAICGPQGFVMDLNYYGPDYADAISLTKQFQIFEKGSFNEIFEVDFVMGFLFAVRTDVFNSGRLKFDNNLTPAWYEEIDIARQVRKLGMKLLAVPTTEFSHGGSGSHIGTNQISYYDKVESKIDILNRNAAYLYHKWFISDSFKR